jgi:PKD repeat protein
MHPLVKRLLLVALLTSLARMAYGQTGSGVSSYELAAQFAEQIRATSEHTAVVDPEPLRVWYSDTTRAVLLYRFVAADGFVMVSGSSDPTMVLAWSVHSPIDAGNLPPAMEWWIEAYVAQLEPMHLPPAPSSQISDQTKEADASQNLLSLLGVTPLLQTQWDQRCYYNDSCPADPVAPAYYCARAPAGCVATTLAQIMKYHKWPLQGTGSKTYHSIRYGSLSANFGNTFYAMASMPDVLYAPHPEVARLLWHAGVASQMQYGPYASGTGITDARTALVSYFSYSSTAQIVAKSNYTSTQWHSLMRSEIDQGRPVFYSGVDQTSNTGHAWVLDGYAGTDYFHFNWGWSGIADGYFVFSAMNPLGNASYTAFQEAIINITPDGNVAVAAFTADNTRVDVGQQVNFTPVTAGNITTWEWIFHGGTPAQYTGENPPPVTWSNGGVYDVTLIVYNGITTDTMHKAHYIQVLPMANFTASKTRTEAGKSIDFFDSSMSNQPIQQYRWHFFGGVPSSSTAKNPAGILYPQPGQFTVILEVTSGSHTDKRVFTKAITVYQQCDTLLHYHMPGYYVQPINQTAFQITKLDLDGLTPYHHPAITSGWDYFSEGGGANQFISATSLFQTPGTADNWLIFGPVTIPATGAALQWRHKMPDHTKRDGYQVFFNTTGPAHTVFTGQPQFVVGDNDPFTLGDTVWRWQEVPIPAGVYGGQNLFVGFHHNAHNKFYIALDDLMITRCDTFPHIANLFSFDTLVAAGDTVLFHDLSSGNPDQWQWSFPGGVQINTDVMNPLVVYPAPGTWDVSLTTWYGSVSHHLTKAGYVTVLPSGTGAVRSGIHEISVWPNPFTNILTISGVTTPFRYSVSDLQGRIVKEGSKGTATHHVLQLSNLPAGVWLLRIVCDDGSVMVKRVMSQ